jgi:hypothetical protein
MMSYFWPSYERSSDSYALSIASANRASSERFIDDHFSALTRGWKLATACLRCRHATPTSSDPLLSIQSVAAVGAELLPLDKFEQFDVCWLQKSFAAATAMGLAVDRHPDITLVNLRYGGDFLRADARPARADLVVACYLFSPAPDDALLASRDPYFALSPLHYRPGIWGRSAEAVDAKAIAVLSRPINCYEITAAHFDHPNYVRGPSHVFDFAWDNERPAQPIRLETLLRRDVASRLGF